MGCLISRRKNKFVSDNEFNLLSKDITERKKIELPKDKTEVFSSKYSNLSSDISMNLMHGATMNINPPQSSPHNKDAHHSKLAEDIMKNTFRYNKKSKEKEIGRKTFELKEVQLAGFAIESSAKTTMSEDGMNRFISEWVKGDEIDTKP